MREGYVGRGRVVLVDEIWKGGGGIENGVVRVMNEKMLGKGEFWVGVGMKGVIGGWKEVGG